MKLWQSKPAPLISPSTVNPGQPIRSQEQTAVKPQASTSKYYDTNSSLETNNELNSSPVVAPPKSNPLMLKGLSSRKAMIVSAIITVVVTLFTGATILVLLRKAPNQKNSSTANIGAQDITINGVESSTIPLELQNSNPVLLINGDIISRGSIKVVNSSFTGSLTAGTLTANQIYTLPNVSGTFCLSSNNCNFVTSELLAETEATLTELISQPGLFPASSLLNGISGAVTLQGTGNQIIVTNNGGIITLSTPQDIGTTSSPTFASATLSGNLNIGGTLTLPIDCTVFLNGGSLTTDNLGQVLCTNDESSGAGSSVTTAGGTPGTIPLFTSADVIGDSLLTQSGSTISVAGNLSAFGNGLFRNTADSSTAFQVQNVATDSILNVSTIYDTYTNLVSNGTFESDTPGVDPAGWVPQEYPAQAGTPDIDTNSDPQYVHSGSRSMRVTTTNNTGDGATIPVTTQVNSSYVLSMWIMAQVGTPSISDIVIGHQLLGGGQFTIDCSISKATVGAAASPKWSQFVCSFTTNDTYFSHNIHVRRSNSATAAGVTFYVDDVRLHQTVGNKVQIGSIGTSGTSSLGQLQFAYDGGGSISLQPLIGSGVTGNYILTLPTESGVICTTSNSSPCSTGNDGRYLSKIIQDTASVAVPDNGYLYTFKNTSSALTGGVLDINNGTNTGVALRVSGKIGVNSGTSIPASDATFGDLSFGGNAGITRTINQLKPTTDNTSGGTLKIAGAEGNKAGNGGTLLLQGGNAASDPIDGGGTGGAINIHSGRCSTLTSELPATCTDDGDITLRADSVHIRPWADSGTSLRVTRSNGSTDIFTVDTASSVVRLFNNTAFSQAGSGTFSTGTGAISLNGPTTLVGNFVQPNANTFSTGTGAISLNGNTTVATGMNFIQNGAGTFGTGTGAVSLNGATTLVSSFSQTGANTFSTGTGAVSLNGNVTVAGGSSFTFNGDAFTDLTGTGLQIAGGALQTTLGTDIDLTTEVTGILPVLNGGTGASDAATARSNLSAAQSGANSDITSITGLTAITPTSALTIGATGQALTIQGNASSTLAVSDSGFTATLNFAAPTSNYTVTIPVAGVLPDTVCLENLGNCAGSGGGVTGSGTNNQIAKFTSTGSTVGDSTISDNGSNVTTSVDLIVQGGEATLGAALQAGSLIISDGSSNTATIVVASTAGDYTYTIPSVSASDEFCIKALQNCSGSGGGNAPANAWYLTLQTEPGLSQERTLSFNSTNFDVNDAGADGAYSVDTKQNINTGASPSFAGLTIAGTATLQGANALTLGTASTNTGSILLYGSGSANGITLRGPTSPGVGLTLTLPNETGTLCSTGSVCSGYAASTGGTGYIQNGTSTQSSANFNIQSASAGSVGAVIQGATSQTADLLQLKDSTGATLLGVSAGGNQETIGYINNGVGGIGKYSNFLKSSEQFDSGAGYWTNTNITATSYTYDAPNGLTVADRLVSTAAGGSVSQSYATASTGTYTFSVWAKTASGTGTVNLRIDSTNGSPATGTVASFTATTTWQRFSVTETTSGSQTAVKVNLILPNDATTIGAWGAQLVKDSVPQVYVQTWDVVVGAPTVTYSGVVSNGNSYFTGNDNGGFQATLTLRNDYANKVLSVVDYATGATNAYINYTGDIISTVGIAGQTVTGTLAVYGGTTILGTNSLTFKQSGSGQEAIIGTSGDGFSYGGGLKLITDNALCLPGCGGNGGDITLQTGNGGITGNANGNGGDISLLAGASGSSSGQGGNVYIRAGDGLAADGQIGIGDINNSLITIGSASNTQTLLLQTGVGALNLQTQGTGGINIGTNAVSQPITIGNSAGGAITIGASSGSNLILNDAEWSVTGTGVITTTGNINANSGTIATNQTTGVLFNTTATTVNAFGAAATINLGAAASSTINLGGVAGTSGGTQTIKSINQTAGSTHSASLTLMSGNATGASSNSGNVNIDVGTATGTKGSINIGGVNASTIALGSSTSALQFTGGATFNDAVTLSTTSTFNGAATFNADTDYALQSTENIAITHNLNTATTLGILSILATPSGSNGDISGISIGLNASGNPNGLDNAILINNADDAALITTVFRITNTGGGGYTNIFDVLGIGINSTELSLLDGRDTQLVDTTDAVATAITGTGVLNAGSINTGFGAINVGADSITTSGTIGTAATTTFTGLGATFTGDINASSSLLFSKETPHTIKVNNSTTAATAGAQLSIIGANGNAAGGGAVDIQAGNAGTGFSTGGAVNITAGSSPSWVGGAVNITGGSGNFTPGTVTIQGGNANTGTLTNDIAGGTAVINGGQGVGTGLGGAINFQTAPAGGVSGNSANALVQRLQIRQNGDIVADTDTFFLDAINNRVGIGDATPQYTLTVGSGDLFGVQGADGSLIWEGTSADANETTLTVENPTADITYRLANAAAGTYDICTTAGNCVGVGGGVSESGTNVANQVAYFTADSNITSDADFLFDGTNVDVGGTLFAGTGNAFQVSAAGAIVGVGVNSGTGLIQGTGGLTITGADANLNTSSNFNTNINTGTSTGLVNIGNPLSGAITLDSGVGTIINYELTATGRANFNANTFIGNATSDRLTVTSHILGASPFVFQGATDDTFETTIGVVDPTADITYQFANAAAGTYDICTTVGNCVALPGSTLQQSYLNDGAGLDVRIDLSSTDDSLIFSNPLAGGSASDFVLKVEQLSTDASKSGLLVSNAGPGYSFRVNDDGTDTDSTPLIVTASGDVGIGDATPDAQLDIDSAFTTSNVFGVTSSTITTGDIINLQNNSAVSSGSDLIYGRHLATYVTTVNNSGSLLELDRVLTTNTGGVLTQSGDVGWLTSNCTVTAGTCTDTSNILELDQQYASATGAVLNVLGAGTGNLATYDATNASANGISIDVQSSSSSQYALDVRSANGTSRLYVRADGNVGIGDTSPSALFTVGNGDLFGVNSSGNVQFSDSAHSISLSAETTADAVGNALTISAGDANGSTTGAAGGALNLSGGAAAGSGNNNGGAIVLQSGAATVAGTGGAINITAGSAGVGGIGGAINLQSGANASSVYGTLTLQTSGGKVFIGNSNPLNSSGRLDLSLGSTTTAGLIIRGIAAQTTDFMQIRSQNSGGVTDGDILALTAAGHLGIGDSSPTSLFTVGNGDLFQVNSSGAIAAVAGITTSGNVLASTSDTLSLGSASAEWNELYIGDGDGIYFGLGQEAQLRYDATGTDDRLELTGTDGSLFIEDHLGLGVQALTLTDDGTVNDTLTPNSSYVRVDIDEAANGGIPDLTISEASAKDGDMLIIVNNEQDASEDTFTITNSAGVVQLPGGANITLGPNDSITLIYMNDRWITLSASNN